MSSGRRTTHRIDCAPQLRMFGVPGPVCEESEMVEEEVSLSETSGHFAGVGEGASTFKLSFIDPDPSQIFIGAERLDLYLSQREQTEPLEIRKFLRTLDYSEFERVYKPGLRSPYAVVSMIGLILYGIIRGMSSLRELERLARLDLGCQWITGGVMPDHSSLGRFINRHGELLKETYFEDLTREVLKRTGGSTESVAGDGTVIQAAASRYSTLKAEAALERARRAREGAREAPADEKARKKAENADQVAEVAKEREAARRKKGRDSGSGVVAPEEPEAVVQPLKNGAKAPSYKASVTVNRQRIVTGKEVEPSSEVPAVEPMLEQTERVGQTKVIQARYDAAYFGDSMVDMALRRGLDLLVPEGKANDCDDWEKGSEKQYPKNRFIYESEHDRYRCPAGEYLFPADRLQGSATVKGYVRYKSEACRSCALWSRCTTGKEGRSLKRYAGDEGKEALRAVMQQVGARAEYRKRQAWVEPVFSELTGIQKLRRFRRKGLARVRVEFSLHVSAHNLRRYLVLAGARVGAALMLLMVVVSLIIRAPLTQGLPFRQWRRFIADCPKRIRQLVRYLEPVEPRGAS